VSGQRIIDNLHSTALLDIGPRAVAQGADVSLSLGADAVYHLS
jgi:hypothetical protein